MDARLFTIPVANPHKSEKTYILYWNTGLNQYDPVEFLNRSKNGLLQVKSDYIHRTLDGIGRAEPIRKSRPMNGFPYILELNLPLGKTVTLMRENKFADFAAHVSKVHPIYALGERGDHHKTVAVSFADGKFYQLNKTPVLKR